MNPRTKYLAQLLALALASCANTAARLDEYGAQLANALISVEQLKGGYQDVAQVLADPLATQEDIDTAKAKLERDIGNVRSEISETREALSDVGAAFKQDVAAVKEAALSAATGFIPGVGGTGENGIVSIAVGAALWFLRDWRKKQGNDPTMKALRDEMAKTAAAIAAGSKGAGGGTPPPG